MTPFTTSNAYVFIWLPGQTAPTAAGVIARGEDVYQFAYARSYLERSDSISFYEPELPLREGWQTPQNGMKIHSSLRDGSPDLWGRVVIANQLNVSHPDDIGNELVFMLESGSNRVGALDFQSTLNYQGRHQAASLDELHRASEAVAAGERIPQELDAALLHGTSIGGATPKALLTDDAGGDWIAKFGARGVPFPQVQREACAMYLAEAAGLDVPEAHVTDSLGKKVLLMERFDRPGDGTRRVVLSGLTVTQEPESFIPRASYPRLMEAVRDQSARPAEVGPEVFDRMVFNVAIGNTDDHARNHAAFWDGDHLELTPAYDLDPQARKWEANQAMALDWDGTRGATFANCLDAAEIYGLSRTEARERIDRTVDSIIQNFHSAAEQAQLTEHQRSALWGNEILHPGAFDGYQSTMSSRPQDPALTPEYHQSPEQDAPDHGLGLS